MFAIRKGKGSILCHRGEDFSHDNGEGREELSLVQPQNAEIEQRRDPGGA
jgi:hypothetical protein